jgi:hypothetical protein
MHFYEEHVPANHHTHSLEKRLEQLAKVRAQHQFVYPLKHNSNIILLVARQFHQEYHLVKTSHHHVQQGWPAA